MALIILSFTLFIPCKIREIAKGRFLTGKGRNEAAICKLLFCAWPELILVCAEKLLKKKFGCCVGEKLIENGSGKAQSGGFAQGTAAKGPGDQGK